MISRYERNPVVTKEQVKPSRPDFEVIGAFNAGVAVYGGETVLLLRVAERPIARQAAFVPCAVYSHDMGEIIVLEFPKDSKDIDTSDPRIVVTPGQSYLTSISHFRLARSKDGLHFNVDDRPFLTAGNEYEAFGIEDPRITPLDGRYYFTYSSASECGIVTSLASTADFREVRREGVLFQPDNKDVVLFPGKIGGKFYALTRPSSSYYGKPDIWIAESENLLDWGGHKRIAAIRPGLWDSARVGGGAVPFLTDRGWVEIYHGADAGNCYCLGILLLDRQEPWKVLARSSKPLIVPCEDYEMQGFFGNVMFSCGCTRDGDRITVYYGSADESMSCFTLELADVWANLKG